MGSRSNGSIRRSEAHLGICPALIRASATLNGFEQGMSSQWLGDAVDIGALPRGNKIFGVADDVIEAQFSNRFSIPVFQWEGAGRGRSDSAERRFIGDLYFIFLIILTSAIPGRSIR